MVKKTPKGCRREKNFFRCRKASPKLFDPRSFRTRRKPRGIRFIIACPKGKWSPKTKRCKVGTRLQSILRPIKWLPSHIFQFLNWNLIAVQLDVGYEWNPLTFCLIPRGTLGNIDLLNRVTKLRRSSLNLRNLSFTCATPCGYPDPNAHEDSYRSSGFNPIPLRLMSNYDSSVKNANPPEIAVATRKITTPDVSMESGAPPNDITALI